jgi:hypothetical protein
VPAVSVIEKNQPLLVNYRVKRSVYIVDRLFERGQLRVGPTKGEGARRVEGMWGRHRVYSELPTRRGGLGGELLVRHTGQFRERHYTLRHPTSIMRHPHIVPLPWFIETDTGTSVAMRFGSQ